jgi:hypothetical protein
VPEDGGEEYTYYLQAINENDPPGSLYESFDTYLGVVKEQLRMRVLRRWNEEKS